MSYSVSNGTDGLGATDPGAAARQKQARVAILRLATSGLGQTPLTTPSFLPTTTTPNVNPLPVTGDATMGMVGWGAVIALTAGIFWYTLRPHKVVVRNRRGGVRRNDEFGKRYWAARDRLAMISMHGSVIDRAKALEAIKEAEHLAFEAEDRAVTARPGKQRELERAYSDLMHLVNRVKGMLGMEPTGKITRNRRVKRNAGCTCAPHNRDVCDKRAARGLQRFCTGTFAPQRPRTAQEVRDSTARDHGHMPGRRVKRNAEKEKFPWCLDCDVRRLWTDEAQERGMCDRCYEKHLNDRSEHGSWGDASEYTENCGGPRRRVRRNEASGWGHVATTKFDALVIHGKDSAWARKNWERYGFDYAPGRGELVVWPLSSMRQLRAALQAGGVAFSARSAAW